VKTEVSSGLEELKRQFNSSSFSVREDGRGGVYVVMEPVNLGPKYKPVSTWVGFQIPAQYPYADIYPLFIGADVVRADAIPFEVPVTHGHNFEGRPAIQVSRRTTTAQNGLQNVSTKILKVINFLETLP
jgi:hypothetical protein